VFLTAQVVEETVYLDKDSVAYKVIYQPTAYKRIFSKKIAVFANDTSVRAIGKNYTNNYLNGIYRAYYPSGKLLVFANYYNEKLNGDWTWYSEKGDIITKGKFRNNIKHGYWAYRHVKLYGRYKNGVKHRTWIKYDVNGQKQKSFYRRGRLVRGEEVDDQNTNPPKNNIKPDKEINTVKVAAETDQSKNKQETKKIALGKEYEQAILFVAKNVVLRKELKTYYGTTFKEKQRLKKNFKNGLFLFALSPEILNLDLNGFIRKQKEGEIVVSKIDSVLKNKKLVIDKPFGRLEETNQSLYDRSTDKEAPFVVYFSRITDGVVRVDVVKYETLVAKDKMTTTYQTQEKGKKFEILLLFDKEGVLRGAEYQKK